MRKTTSTFAALLFAFSSVFLTAPAAHGQGSEAMTEAQAEQVSRSLGHSSLDAAVEAGDVVSANGGYALTSSGLANASAAGLLVSPALIPIAVGFGVAFVGLGVVAVADDDSVGAPVTPGTTTTP